MSVDHPDPWIARMQALVKEFRGDAEFDLAAASMEPTDSAKYRLLMTRFKLSRQHADKLAALLTERAASLEWPKLTPEHLDAECHCGDTPEGVTLWGTRCPVIEHRARSGEQWRYMFVEQYEYFRSLRINAAPASPADPPPLKEEK